MKLVTADRAVLLLASALVTSNLYAAAVYSYTSPTFGNCPPIEFTSYTNCAYLGVTGLPSSTFISASVTYAGVLAPNLNRFTVSERREPVDLTADAPLDWLFSDGVRQWTPANSHFYVAVVNTDSNGIITGWDFTLYSNPGFTDPEVYTISSTPPSSYAPRGSYGSSEVVLSLSIPNDYAYVFYGGSPANRAAPPEADTPWGLALTSVPEPTNLAVLGAALAGLGVLRRYLALA